MPPVHTGHIQVGRTARYHMTGTDGGVGRELWIVLHGYGQLAAEFLATFEPLAGPERTFAAPEALSRYYGRGGGGRIGASWMTREDREHEIADYVAYLDRLHAHLVAGRGDVRTCVLGFSQGCATAARWSALGSVRPARLVLWASAWPPDLDPEPARAALEGTRVDVVWGTEDTWVPPERRPLEEKLVRRVAPSAAFHTFDGGHEIEPGLLARLVDG